MQHYPRSLGSRRTFISGLAPPGHRALLLGPLVFAAACRLPPSSLSLSPSASAAPSPRPPAPHRATLRCSFASASPHSSSHSWTRRRCPSSWTRPPVPPALATAASLTARRPRLDKLGSPPARRLLAASAPPHGSTPQSSPPQIRGCSRAPASHAAPWLQPGSRPPALASWLPSGSSPSAPLSPPPMPAELRRAMAMMTHERRREQEQVGGSRAVWLCAALLRAGAAPPGAALHLLRAASSAPMCASTPASAAATPAPCLHPHMTEEEQRRASGSGFAGL
ncbi:hypothetical protein BS78_06G113300 [Paspalum vaginatum]|nr:hypothetical protein BS78_06G113300 [Paspalum vaginatum]